MAGETTVGSIVGFLRLDASDWNRTLTEAGAAAARLGSADPNVEVHADTGQAIAGLAAVDAAASAVDHSDPTIDVNANTAGAEAGLARAQGRTRALVTAALLLGPALAPVAGAAAGLGLAFGGLGAAGALAFLGIKNAMKNGSEAGVEFGNGIDKLKGNLDLLAATAAGGVLSAFSGVVSDLQGKMPQIQNGVGVLSTELGQVLRPAADGITTAFIGLLPLMTNLADYAIKGANAFNQWAHGDGLQKFGGYAAAVLPGVLDTLGQLIQLAGNVAGAFSGWGSVVLSSVGLLASLLNSLPQGVLSVLASGGLAVYAAFKGFGLLQSVVSGFGGALSTMATNLGRVGAAGTASRLQGVASGLTAVGTAGSIASIAVGGISAVLGVALFAWSLYKQRQQEAKAAQEAMTQAIQEDTGALGDNSRKVIAKSIADGDLIGKAKELGISQHELTGAITGNGAAFDSVNKKLAENGSVTKYAASASGTMVASGTKLGKNAQSLHDSIGRLNKQIKTGKSSYDANKMAAKALGDELGSTEQSMSTAQLAQISLTNATKDQKKAIDELNSALDAEISKQLQLQGGLTGEAAARNSMIETLKKSKSTTDLNTDAGVKNRQGIESAVGQLQSYMSTQEKAGKTTAEATSTYVNQGNELLRSIAKTDGASSATYRYAQQLLKLPKDVKSKVGIEGNEVAASQLAGLGDKARKLGNTKVMIPLSTPNAHQTAQVLNTIDKSVLSVNGKSVRIPTAAINSPETLRNLQGIKGARVNADGSVSIPTKALNAATTIGLLGNLGRVAVDADGKQVVIPSSVPNAPKVISLIGQIHGAQISANGKRVVITSSAPLAADTKRKIDNIRGAQVTADGKHVTINTSVPNYGSVLGQIQGLLAAARDKSFTVTANYITNRVNHVTEQLDRISHNRANGGVTLPGGHRAMADGGILGRQAMIAGAGSNILWAEDSTGGESYIPWAASKRSRATDILATTAGGFGYDLVPQGAGAGGGDRAVTALASQVAALTKLVASQAQSPARTEQADSRPVHIQMNNVPMDNANTVAKELLYAYKRNGVGKFAGV